MTDLPAIGWREWVALPDLGVSAVKAKVDTGARSSSLHAWNVEPFDREGAQWLRFIVHPLQDDESIAVIAEAPWVDERDFRSSNGETERRPIIATNVVVLGGTVPIELSLTRRDEMGFRMLLGRRALRRRFVVDPGQSFLGGGTRFTPPSP